MHNKRKRKRWITLFPECENVHLCKDIGMIPYTMQRYYGYMAKVVCYRNSENYDYVEEYVKGLEIEFLRKYTNSTLVNGIIYLLLNARKIDVLNIYHITSIRNFYWILVFKILHPSGKVYLKTDLSFWALDYYNFSLRGWKKRVEEFVLGKVDLISVECRTVYEWLCENWSIPVRHICNGYCSDTAVNIEESCVHKDNIIMFCAADLEDPVKNTLFLIQAFVNNKEIYTDWKLHLVGKYTDAFLLKVKEVCNDIEFMKEHIIFKGYIEKKTDLSREFSRAKVFCMCSLHEAFPLVALDALANGCFLILSDTVDAAKDLTNNGKIGSVFELADRKTLEQELLCICSDEKMIKDNEYLAKEYAKSEFDWKTISQEIINCLEKKA